MDNLDKKTAARMALVQQSARLANKAAPVIAVAALLQEAVNLNQQLSNEVLELAEALKNDREAKCPDADGGKVPGTAQSRPT